MISFRNLFLLCTVFACCCSTAVQAEVEAIKGKKYPLTAKHGPWMIMVASLRNVDEDWRKGEGLTAEEAADQLVYELRRTGIPAYTWAMDEKVEQISSPQPNSSRRYVAQHGSISVLAGNFPSNNHADAKRALDYIKKKFNPSFLGDPKNGGILPRSKDRTGPLSRAFLTANPLYEGEIRDAEKDSFIVDLNADQKFSLLQNKGRFSLVVATFHGGSVMQVSGSDATRAMGFFDRNFGKSLDECAVRAMELTEALRSARKHGYEEDFEAWVFHEKYKSMVSIGSFTSKDDPRIRPLMARFSGKNRRNPRTGEDVLVGESFTVPRLTKPGQVAKDSWVFDGTPYVMEIPQIR